VSLASTEASCASNSSRMRSTSSTDAAISNSVVFEAIGGVHRILRLFDLMFVQVDFRGDV